MNTKQEQLPTQPEGDGAKDGARLKFVRANCLTVECYSVPTGGDDSEEAWRVVEYHMSKPRERYIGYGDTPQKAIDDAMASETAKDGANEEGGK